MTKAEENYQGAVRHISRLDDLTRNELEEVRDIAYSKLAEGRKNGFDNWYNEPKKRTGADIVEDIDNMLNDPEYIRLLPSYYFEAEKILEEVKERLQQDVATNPVQKTITSQDAETNPFPDIFTLEGSKLFMRIEKNMTDKDKSVPFFSTIYLYLDNERMTVCNEAAYRVFISNKFDVKFDRIEKREGYSRDKRERRLADILRKT